MADIFDEINEELKQDRMTALWQRYGKYAVSYTHLTLPTNREE